MKSVKAFLKAANKNAAQASAIQPGFYQMHVHMSGASAFSLLLNPKSRAGTTIILPEGLRLTETIAALARKTGIPLKEFQAAAKIQRPSGCRPTPAATWRATSTRASTT